MQYQKIARTFVIHCEERKGKCYDYWNSAEPPKSSAAASRKREKMAVNPNKEEICDASLKQPTYSGC